KRSFDPATEAGIQAQIRGQWRGGLTRVWDYGARSAGGDSESETICSINWKSRARESRRCQFIRLTIQSIASSSKVTAELKSLPQNSRAHFFREHNLPCRARRMRLGVLAESNQQFDHCADRRWLYAAFTVARADLEGEPPLLK